jgi:hypothetical protein
LVSASMSTEVLCYGRSWRRRLSWGWAASPAPVGPHLVGPARGAGGVCRSRYAAPNHAACPSGPPYEPQGEVVGVMGGRTLA